MGQNAIKSIPYCGKEVFLANGGRSATTTGADRTGNAWASVAVVVDVTVNAGGLGSITVSVQGKDANGIYYTILSSAALTAVATTVYTVGLGVPNVANVSAGSPLPETWRVVVTHNNGNGIFYSVGLQLQT